MFGRTLFEVYFCDHQIVLSCLFFSNIENELPVLKRGDYSTEDEAYWLNKSDYDPASPISSFSSEQTIPPQPHITFPSTRNNTGAPHLKICPQIPGQTQTTDRHKAMILPGQKIVPNFRTSPPSVAASLAVCFFFYSAVKF